VATALQHLGVYLGNDSDFQPASEQNPGGFWELIKVQELNARALQTFGMDYFRAVPLASDWREVPGVDEIVNRMSELLRETFDSKPCWGWKDPSTAILMPLWKEALRRAGRSGFAAAIVVRHPLSVAASQRARYRTWGYEAEQIGAGELPAIERRTVGLWINSTICSLQQSRGNRRQVIVYENFLKDPASAIRTMSDKLLLGAPSVRQRETAVASIDPQLSHTRPSPGDLHSFPAIVYAIYDLANRMECDVEGTNSGIYGSEIEKLSRDWHQLSDLARPIELPAADMHFVWLEGQRQERTSLPYMQTGGWQKVRIKIPAPPNSTVQIDPCQLPCRIWIRKAVWQVEGGEQAVALKPGPNGILEQLGMLRLTVTGRAALLALTPPAIGVPTLEMEILVQSNEGISRDIITMMQKREERARKSVMRTGVAGMR
jgi:hypothetical protein